MPVPYRLPTVMEVVTLCCDCSGWTLLGSGALLVSALVCAWHLRWRFVACGVAVWCSRGVSEVAMVVFRSDVALEGVW